MFQAVTVEEVVGIEGDEAAIRVDDVDAGFLDAADIEGAGVDGSISGSWAGGAGGHGPESCRCKAGGRVTVGRGPSVR